MSKSELRRIEIVAPNAIKQLREQIAREIEAIDLTEAKTISSDWYAASVRLKTVAAIIARGKK